MKTLFQLLIIAILIFTCLITYKKFFNIKKNLDVKIYEENFKKNIMKNSNNSIKNLSYNVKIRNGKEYIIKAKSGEISVINNSEVVRMNDVAAKITFNNKTSIIIISDKAVYNALNYNTVFEKNVRVDYLNHIIKSNKILFNNINEVIEIKDNVIYQGPYGSILSENAKIDLFNKNINIYSNSPNEKVKVISELNE